jgi:hypothetical protein
MSTFINICMALAMASVLGVLAVGLISMIKGGEFNKKYGNKLMRARVILQGVALALLALAIFTSTNNASP